MSKIGASQPLFDALESRTLFSFGQSDLTFGTAGRAIAGFAADTPAPAIQQLLTTSKGKILSGGPAGLAQFTSRGQLDSTFGVAGETPFGPSVSYVADAIDPTIGSIYVVFVNSGGTGFLRYTANGKVDKTFGTKGSVLVSSSKTFKPTAMAVQADGKIVVAGTFATDVNQGQKVRVLRVLSDGSADSGFGTGGVEEFSFGQTSVSAPIAYDHVAKVAIVSGNKIDIIGGSVTFAPFVSPSTPAKYDKAIFAVARLTTSGNLDGGYTGGIARSAYASGSVIGDIGIKNIWANAAAVRSNDSVLVAASVHRTIVTEFDANGTLKYSSSSFSGSALAKPTGLVALPDGRAVVVAFQSAFIGQGVAFAAISAGGEFQNTIFTFDSDPNTEELTFTGIGNGATTAADGSLLIGGAGSTNGDYLLQKFTVGKATDPRPDDFAHGTVNDIATDTKGNLYLAWYDSSTTHLMFSHRQTNGIWDKTIVLDKNAEAGQNLSLDLNSKGAPGIAYYDGTNGDLKLAQLVGTHWKFENVDHKGDVGLAPSLDYDDKDEPVVSYYNLSKHHLNFAIKNGNTHWTYEVVDTSGDDVGRSSALVASPTTRRYTIAYTDTTSKKVMWARHSENGTWGIKTAAITTGGADFVSMAYGKDIAPMIAFFDEASADLKISSFQNGVFSVKTLASVGVQGSYTSSLFARNDGLGEVYAYNRSKNQVSLFIDVNSNSPKEVVAATDGGKYLSVAQRGTSFDTMIDLAFVDSTTGKLKIRPSINPNNV